MDGESFRNDGPLAIERADGVAVLRLDRPKALNALSDAMLEALQRALDALRDDASVRVVVLEGAGGHFCAGHDLREMTARRADADGGRAAFERLFETCSRLMRTIATLPQPVIAQVEGVATAAGCQLVAAADLAVASETARFATSGVTIGLFCATPAVALSRVVGRKQALEMLFTGDFIDARRALEIGLVNRVATPAELAAVTRALAHRIAAHSSAAIAIGKASFLAQERQGLAEAYALAGRAMAENMMTADAEAGIGAFLAKKPAPTWSGR